MRFKNKNLIIYWLPASFLILLTTVYLSSCTSTYIGRVIWWNFSDIEDYKKFPKHDIQNEAPAFHFSALATPMTLPEITFTCLDETITLRNNKEWDSWHQKNDTTSFIVIKDDTVLYEKYYNGYQRDSINTSFSMAKSYTSILIGIAIEEGLIESVNDPITKYLPEMKKENLHEITIRQLLTMTAGFRYAHHVLPWGDGPRHYYEPRLREYVLSELESVDKPDEKWDYNEYETILLGVILERVTGKPPSWYLEEKIWKPLGMEFAASWSLDSEESGMVKMESGINARSIDFAKFGRLILNQGKWNGMQIVSTEWITESTQYDPENPLLDLSEMGNTDFRMNNSYYKYQWWGLYGSNDEVVAIGAVGHLGQYILVMPQYNMIIVRNGSDSPGRCLLWSMFLELGKQFSKKEF